MSDDLYTSREAALLLFPGISVQKALSKLAARISESRKTNGLTGIPSVNIKGLNYIKKDLVHEMIERQQIAKPKWKDGRRQT